MTMWMTGEVAVAKTAGFRWDRGRAVGALVVVWCAVVGVVSQAAPPSSVPLQDVCLTEKCTQRAADMIRLMINSADPCHDFWHYACGGWTQSLSQWDRQSATVRHHLARLLSAPVHVKDPSAVRMTKKLYQSCMDYKTLEKLGPRPLTDVINRVFRHFPSDLTSRLLAVEELVGPLPLLDVGVGLYHRNSSIYVWHISRASLNLEQELYLGNRSATFMPKYAKIIAHVLHWMRPGVGRKEWKARGRRVVALEVKLAEMVRSLEKKGKQEEGVEWLYGTHSLSSLQSRYPDLHWHHYLQGLGRMYRVHVPLHPHQIIVSSTDHFLDQLFPLVRHASPQVLHDYLLWSSIFELLHFTVGGPLSSLTHHATVKTRAFRTQFRNIIIPTKKGARKKHCVRLIKDTVPEVVGYMFTQAFSNAGQRARVQKLVHNVVEAAKHDVESSSWLSPVSKRRTLEKLTVMRTEVGVPSRYSSALQLDRKYAGVNVTSVTLLENVLRVHWRRSKRILELLSQPATEVYWEDSSQVNAFYMDLSNVAVIPTGILQQPVFSLSVPDALNYGSLGMVVGHEVLHALDPTGRLYDEHGNLGDWWSRGDGLRYKDRAQCFRDQFDHFKFQGVDSGVDGNLTLDENIADSTGLNAAFLAFQKQHSTQERLLPGLMELTSEQLFFLAFAQTWCSLDSGKICHSRTDSHSPKKERVLGSLMNSPHFARVFQCSPGSPMNPLGKCILWK